MQVAIDGRLIDSRRTRDRVLRPAAHLVTSQPLGMTRLRTHALFTRAAFVGNGFHQTLYLAAILLQCFGRVLEIGSPAL